MKITKKKKFKMKIIKKKNLIINNINIQFKHKEKKILNKKYKN